MEQFWVEQTAYYLNRELPRLALVAKGVPLPPGRWVLVADGEQPPWKVQQQVATLIAVPNGGLVPFIALLTDFDVLELEKELREGGVGR